MALSVGNLLTKHFLLAVNMSLVTLFVVGLLVPSILSLPHFVKRQVEAPDVSTTAPSATTMVIVETTTSTEDLEGTTEALTTTEGLPAETTESSMTTEGEPIETTESSMTTEVEPIETTQSSMTTDMEPIETTESSMATEGEPMGTTESMATDETPTDTTESSTAVVEVEGSTAIITIPIDILSNLTEVTTETELITAMTTSTRKKRSVLDKDSAENTKSAESEGISSESTEDNENSAMSEEKDDSEVSETKEDSTKEVTEPEELENSAFSRPPSELFTSLTNRLPIVGVLPSLTVGDFGFLGPIIRQPAKPQVIEVFHDLPTDGETENFDTGIRFNQENGFNAVNFDPQFTDKVNYENLQFSEDPEVDFFNTIFYNFFEQLQNIIYELKARKTVDSKINMHKHDHENILENENPFIRQPNHYPSSTKDHLVTLKLMLGLTEKETPRDIPSTYHGGKEAFYNV